MTGSVRQIAYRLKSEGKAEVIRDQREIKGAITDAFNAADQGAEKASAALDRQTRKYQGLALAARESAEAQRRQSALNSWMGIGVEGKSARDSAALFEAEAIAAENAAASAARLKAVLDPVGAAQDRLNNELAEYASLAKRGEINSEQLAQAQVMARRRFDETTTAIERQSRGLSRNAVASRLNLARQGADVAVTAAMGMNPAMIAIQQGPQILDALATSGLRATPVLIGLGVAVGAVAGAVGVLGAAWLAGEDAALDYERAVSGLGRTARLSASELEALTVAAAEQGEVSIRSAREQAASYLATGRIGGEVISGLVKIGRDYASVMGMDAEEATQSLAQAMLAPDKAARDLTRTMGLLDQKTLDHIDSLVKSGDLLAAQKLLIEALDGAMSGHAERVGDIATAWDWAARTVSNYWDKLGAALYTTPDERIEALREGRGYSQNTRASGDRELKRLEIMRDYRDMVGEWTGEYASRNQTAQQERDRRDAANRGRRSGGNSAAEAEREARETLQRERRAEDRRAQMAMEIARASSQTQVIRRLEEEAAVRQRIRELVDDGMEADKARVIAGFQQVALGAARQRIGEREVADLFRANALEVDRIDGANRMIQIEERRIELRERYQAYLAAELDHHEAGKRARADQQLADEARLAVMQRINTEARAAHELDLARARGDDRLVRDLENGDWVERRAREIEERGRNGTRLNRGEGNVQAEVELAELLKAEADGARRDWVRGFASDIRRSGIGAALGEQFESASDRLIDRLLDSFLDIDWASIMGFGAKSDSFLGNLVGFGASLLGGGGRANVKIGANAAGTDYWTGGLSWVGENGPELLDLPRGSKVIEHNRAMAQAINGGSGGGGGFTFAPQIDARGAGPREVDRLEAKMDQMAAALPNMIRQMTPGIVNDGLQRRTIRPG